MSPSLNTLQKAFEVQFDLSPSAVLKKRVLIDVVDISFDGNVNNSLDSPHSFQKNFYSVD